jgi:hypothetical protein
VGSNVKLVINATRSVVDVNAPRAIVPPKSDNTNMINPAKRIIEV